MVYRIIPVAGILAIIFACRVSANCQQTFTNQPSNHTNLSVGQTGPVLYCEVSDNSLVDWYHMLNGERINSFGISNFTSNTDESRAFLSNLRANTGITLADDTHDINFNTIRTIQHGQFQCKIRGCEIYSDIGTVSIQSKVEMRFEGQTTNDNVTLHAKAGQELHRRFRVFGAPTPSLSVAKQGTDGVFRLFNDSRITITLTRFIFRSIQLKDGGHYAIWGNNSHGNSEFRFNISVTGVDAPNITLSKTKHTPPQYGTLIKIMCTIQDSAYEAALRLYWAFDNKTALPLHGSSVIQEDMGNTTTVLTILQFDESHNGEYICFANNSNNDSSASVTIIGPPARVTKPTISGDDTTAVIEWTEPASYGAKIVNYMIQYRIEEADRNTIIKNVSTGSHSLRYVDSSFCPGGYYSFRVAAVNEYGSVGEFSEYSNGKTITARCSPTTTTTSGASSNTLTESSSTNSMGTMGTVIAPTVTTISGGTNNPTVSLTSAVTPTSVTTKPNNSLPLAAGAAAGTLLLIIASAGLLVAAIFCWVNITRRSSRRKGKTQWRHPGEEDNIDASLSTQSLPDKTSELHVDLCIPSPLPATPGYGPLYIDPCYEFPRENLELTDILYDGSYTVIYKAKALGIKENKAIEVAVKTVKNEFLDIDDLTSSLVMEMEQLSQLEPHPNIVGLIRVCTVGRPVYMVMEYMCHGDLLGFLRATRGHTDMYTVFPGTKNLPTQVKLRSRDLLHIIGQVASGMQFLSELKVSHGALCARNILVGTSMEVKVFNIGAHNIDNGENNDYLIRWLAPEVLVDGHRTTYSDIWSFGVLMWEVVTVGGTPYSEIELDELYTHLMSGMRLQRPAHCAEPIYDIMSSCWEAIPQHRPLFIEIIDQLQSLNDTKISFLDLRNYNEMQYSQFDLNEASQMSVL